MTYLIPLSVFISYLHFLISIFIINKPIFSVSTSWPNVLMHIFTLEYALHMHILLSTQKSASLLPFYFHLELQMNQLCPPSPYPQPIHSGLLLHKIYTNFLIYSKPYPRHSRNSPFRPHFLR